MQIFLSCGGVTGNGLASLDTGWVTGWTDAVTEQGLKERYCFGYWPKRGNGLHESHQGRLHKLLSHARHPSKGGRWQWEPRPCLHSPSRLPFIYHTRERASYLVERTPWWLLLHQLRAPAISITTFPCSLWLVTTWHLELLQNLRAWLYQMSYFCFI